MIEGTGTSPGTDWEDNQYKYNIQEMARLLTEHPGNKKPGPGYTGYYLQDHMFYVGVHDSIPEIGLDYLIMKPNIYWTIFKLAQECDSYDKVIFYYTAKGDSLISGGITEYFFDADDSNNINTVLDVKPLDTTGNMDGLCHYLRLVNCKDMVIMLQPDYSGDWIFPLSFDIPGGGFPQTNRVIITSEQSGQTSDFDLCNMEPSEFENPSPPPDQIIVDVYDIGTGNDDDAPFGDGEEYQSTPGGQWKYQVNKYEDSPHEDLYEIDDVNEDPFVLRFYENWNDEGAEFVSGFAEAYFIDLFNEDNVVSNDILDSDEYTINGFNSYSHFPSITGNDNDYVSCKEAYNYMKLWHIGYRLNKSPWVDTPQIEYTCFDDGTMYLY